MSVCGCRCRCDKQKSVKMREVRSRCESPRMFPPAAGKRTRYARRPKSGTPVALRVGVILDPPYPPRGACSRTLLRGDVRLRTCVEKERPKETCTWSSNDQTSPSQKDGSKHFGWTGVMCTSELHPQAMKQAQKELSHPTPRRASLRSRTTNLTHYCHLSPL